jgi:hypothetical protein
VFTKVINNKAIFACPVPFNGTTYICTIHSNMFGVLVTLRCFDSVSHEEPSIVSTYLVEKVYPAPLRRVDHSYASTPDNHSLLA